MRALRTATALASTVADVIDISKWPTGRGARSCEILYDVTPVAGRRLHLHRWYVDAPLWCGVCGASVGECEHRDDPAFNARGQVFWLAPEECNVE